MEKTARTGLSGKVLEELRRVISAYGNVERAVIYGSRAKGKFRPFSDIDISLVGKSVTHDDLTGIMSDLEMSWLPYEVDVCRYDHLNKALKAEINLYGLTL